jgi:diacylglycerol O-acyltransferase
MPRRVRMSPVDTAWLRMDSAGNLMMIVGVMLFDGQMDLRRLRRVVQQRFLAYDRFRSRVVQDAAGYWWEIDPDFDLEQHVVAVNLPGRADMAELQRFAGLMAAEALDPNRPLWQFQVVQNYAGGAAVIVRIHHCIADGIALIGVLLSMTSSDPAHDDGAGQAAAGGAPADGRAHSGNGASAWEAWLRPFTAATVRAIDATGDLASRVLHASGVVLEDPHLASEAATQYARVAARLAQDAAQLALMETDSVTSLKGRTTGSKAVAWNEPISLQDVKAVGHALGCSVNDVLLACAAGAFRSYLLSRGEDVEGCELRAMVPVNLRPPGKAGTLGNKFGLVPLLLPVGIENPIARVLELHRRMDELKGGYMPVLSMLVLGMSGLVPQAVQNQILALFQKKATAVMTNVPGPQQPLYLAGSRIRQMMFWVPQSGDIGVGVSILSYDGGVQFGLVTDKRLCARPQDVIDRFRPEFESLVYALLLLPWDEEVDPELAERALFSTESLAAVASELQRRPQTRAAGGKDAGPGKVRRRASRATDSATPTAPAAGGR